MFISHTDRILTTTFLPPPLPTATKPRRNLHIPPKNAAVSLTCSLKPKHARCPKLDSHVTRSNRIRFVTKLKTLLLSKPKHFLPLRVLSKCRSYLSVSHHPHTLLSLIHRYPSIFQLFTIPTPPHSTSPFSQQLCVRLTPAAQSLALRESRLHSEISFALAKKLQKLLMLATHRRLLLSKLVHIAPALGLPPNFRSRLCNDFPHLFRTVDTSYGRALELVSWDDDVAAIYQCSNSRNSDSDRELIVDRPLKFKRVRLRKGLNVKRRHQEFLIRFAEVGEVCPYRTCVEEFAKDSLEAEKRACGVVREVLGMCVEKRTLVDHLTHFRKDFGLPNKLRAMIVRHPELFYVSCKGLRDSLFLVEAFDDKGNLLEKDESLVINDQLMELVREAKRMRHERRKRAMENGVVGDNSIDVDDDDVGFNNDNDDYDDGLENLFETEDSSPDFEFEDEIDESSEFEVTGENSEFWVANASSAPTIVENGSKVPW